MENSNASENSGLQTGIRWCYWGGLFDRQSDCWFTVCSLGASPGCLCKSVYKGQMPNVGNPNIEAAKTYVLCFNAFGVQESSVTKTPLWSGEHLTAARVTAAKQIPRKNTFHSEKQIPPADQAKLSDYLGQHYDRGHMSPDDDMPDAVSQFQSFSLANMVPQKSCNNEIVWKAIETSVRNYTLAHSEVYVVTGPNL